MKYKEALQLIENNNNLLNNVGTGSVPLELPFYKLSVIIAPTKSTLVEVSDIYAQLADKTKNNKILLENLGMLNEDLDVFIIGAKGEIISMSEYLKRKEED